MVIDDENGFGEKSHQDREVWELGTQIGSYRSLRVDAESPAQKRRINEGFIVDVVVVNLIMMKSTVISR
jgi:hypothetical protein